MKTALLMISDGRYAYHAEASASAALHLPEFDHVIHIDDAAHTLGFGGAIIEGWRRVLETDAEFIFHLELDFTFDRAVPVGSMISALHRYPHLAQMALQRQPVNDTEIAAGGVLAVLETAGSITWRGQGEPFNWIEHTHNFTTNPSVYPRWIVERGWPDETESEGKFGIYLMRDRPHTRFAYWGQGEEWCTHIGHERTGGGY